MKIENLINKSGDSYLEDFYYKNGIATLLLDIEELEIKVKINVKTNFIACDISECRDRPFRTCFLELIELSEILQSKNGIYIATEEFGRFMKEKRENLNLAYGLKTKEHHYIFSLVANYKLVSFIIEKLEDITIINKEVDG